VRGIAAVISSYVYEHSLQKMLRKGTRMMNITDFNADFPYPEIRLEKKDPQIAQFMLSDLADPVGEASSVVLYLFDTIVLHDDDEFSKVFKNIYQTEMIHAEIFADLAYQAGAEPRLWSTGATGKTQRNLSYWSPGRVAYATDKKTIVRNAIALERASIEKYETQISLAKNDTLSLILRRILLDEQLHIEMFNALLNKLQ
jgi:bacterioferritin